MAPLPVTIISASSCHLPPLLHCTTHAFSLRAPPHLPAHYSTAPHSAHHLPARGRGSLHATRAYRSARLFCALPLLAKTMRRCVHTPADMGPSTASPGRDRTGRAGGGGKQGVGAPSSCYLLQRDSGSHHPPCLAMRLRCAGAGTHALREDFSISGKRSQKGERHTPARRCAPAMGGQAYRCRACIGHCGRTPRWGDLYRSTSLSVCRTSYIPPCHVAFGTWQNNMARRKTVRSRSMRMVAFYPRPARACLPAHGAGGPSTWRLAACACRTHARAELRRGD